MTTPLKIMISGLYCGPSPSPGLGVARSIREAYPTAHLLGFDYWEGSSGIQSSVFDEVKVLPSWNLMDEGEHQKFLREKLSEGYYYLPTLDLELQWVALHLSDVSERVMSPSTESLDWTTKPHLRMSESLGVPAPEYILMDRPDDELYDFCRRHSWRVWLKGPYHDAVFVESWRALSGWARHLRGKWRSDRVFLQAHFAGIEESICFIAKEGHLLDCIAMQKRVITPEGKTWSGKISTPSQEVLNRVSQSVRQSKWTGAGEIELLRNGNQETSLLEINPRFPAWIFGSAIAGRNLPAKLVEAFSSIPFSRSETKISSEFTRVVTEIPVGEKIPLPFVAVPNHGQVASVGKYAAGMGNLAQKIEKPKATEVLVSSPPSNDFFAPEEIQFQSDLENSIRGQMGSFRDLKSRAHKTSITPSRVFIEKVASSHFSHVQKLMRASSSGNANPKILGGYSVKTCPDSVYLNLAKTHGLHAECISMGEVEHAIAHGFQHNQIILNGPAKWWPLNIHSHQNLYAVFADSLEEFEDLVNSTREDQIWGVRLKIPGFPSRFGISLHEFSRFEKLCELIQMIPPTRKLGLHIHLASNLIGNGHWQDGVESLAAWGSQIENATGRKISVVDLGGGYHPRDLRRNPFDEIAKFIQRSLPSVETVIMEPGRAVTQDTMAIVTSILDIRRTPESRRVEAVVVDTCISELPLINVYPHRLYLRRGDILEPLLKGQHSILGRVCMEDDYISSQVNLPYDLKVGDQIVIADAGAYERSMSYDFGRGSLSSKPANHP